MNRQLRSGKELLVTVPVKRPYKRRKVGEPVVVVEPVVVEPVVVVPVVVEPITVGVELADEEPMNKLILDETAEDESPAKLPVVEPVVVLMAYLL